MLYSALYLAILSVFSWALFMYVLKPVAGFSFVRTPIRTFLYFLLLSTVLVVLFHPLPLALLTSSSWLPPATLLGAVLILFPAIYYDTRARVKNHLYEEHRDLELLALDYRFLFSKLGDVVFQQLTFGIFVLLFATYIPFVMLTILSAVLFVLGHVGLLFRMPHHWSGYFLTSAFFGGLALPFLFLYITGGIYYAILFHMLWYVLSGVLFRYMKR